MMTIMITCRGTEVGGVEEKQDFFEIIKALGHFFKCPTVNAV